MENSREVTKAVITAAGYGTRFLPATKNIPKEMLPIIDTPIIHYVVEEFVNSGIKDIIIVTRYGNTAVEDYFDSLTELESFLKERGKLDKLDSIRKASRMANFAFIRQGKNLPYGNASPLIAARPYLGNENFALAWGDDITLSDTPVLKQLVDKFQTNDCEAVIAVEAIKPEEVHHYATVKFKEGTTDEVEEIIEKPKIGKEYSNLASFGRYVFSPEILNLLDPKDTGKDNELWLVDAIHKLIKTHKVLAHTISGKWMTTGDPLRFLMATFEMALRREDLRDEILAYLKKRINETI